LSSKYNNNHIVVHYGYLWDQVQTGRIVWQTIVGYGANSRSGTNQGSLPGASNDGESGHGNYRSCSAECKAVESDCISNCGIGPDHVNNPGWLSCRKSCRESAGECRSACP
jgi:hypothetical protein